MQIFSLRFQGEVYGYRVDTGDKVYDLSVTSLAIDKPFVEGKIKMLNLIPVNGVMMTEDEIDGRVNPLSLDDKPTKEVTEFFLRSVIELYGDGGGVMHQARKRMHEAQLRDVLARF